MAIARQHEWMEVWHQQLTGDEPEGPGAYAALLRNAEGEQHLDLRVYVRKHGKMIATRQYIKLQGEQLLRLRQALDRLVDAEGERGNDA